MANRNITSPYSASITGCGFMYEEMRALLPMLMSSDRDLLLKEELRTGEHLMMSSERARSRAIPEFVKRYNAVPKSFWTWFLTLNDKSQRVAMFYVILKTYKIVFDLHINVVMEHWRGVEQRVTKNDLMMEFNEISARDAFVESWSENTKETGFFVSVFHIEEGRSDGREEFRFEVCRFLRNRLLILYP